MTYEEMKKIEINFDKLAKKIREKTDGCPYSEKEIAYQLHDGCKNPFIMLTLHEMEKKRLLSGLSEALDAAKYSGYIIRSLPKHHEYKYNIQYNKYEYAHEETTLLYPSMDLNFGEDEINGKWEIIL